MSSVGKLVSISDLRIYPIKSCRGISLKSSKLTRQGLQHDRKWMFVDATNNFITIRQKSQMTLINTAINEETQTLQVTLPAVEEAGLNKRSFEVPLAPDQAYLDQNCKKIDVVIWEYDTDAYTYTSAEINDAVADFFKTIDPKSDVKFVMKGPTPRNTRGNGAPDQLGRTETVNFPDVLPIQVASEASLKELNERLTKGGHEEISIERFRPNIIFKEKFESTDEDHDEERQRLDPWEEDIWRTLRINPSPSQVAQVNNGTSLLTTLTSTLRNSLPAFLSGTSATTTTTTTTTTTEDDETKEKDIVIDVSARCARCQVPNVDPATGIKNPKQPWDTLVSYRRVDPGIKYKPCFGMLCCPRSTGVVRVGMSIQVLEVFDKAKGEEHVYIKGF